MYRLTLGDFDRQSPPASRNRYPEKAKIERRHYAVRTNLCDEVRQRIQLHRFERLRLPVVGHTQNETTATVVGKCGQLVGQSVSARANNSVTSKVNFFQFQTGVLAEHDLFPQPRYVYCHGTQQTPPAALSSGRDSS